MPFPNCVAQATEPVNAVHVINDDRSMINTKNKLFPIFLLPLFFCASLYGQVRQETPVVLTGDRLPDLLGVSPLKVAAFKWANDHWQQIPVQIDERAVKNVHLLYDGLVNDFYDVEFLVYTDPQMYTGPDEDPTFDADDELVFMARDAGQKFNGASSPPGTSGSPTELLLSDPITGTTSYVYLFRHDGSLLPDAGRNYVDYQFQLDSGDYLDSYLINELNPEHSSVQTAYYSQRYTSEWVRDQIRIEAGNSTGVDLLDQDKTLLGPGVCHRTVETFSEGRGIHIASKDGPVRAIRSWMGANSGPLTQRTHLFYERTDEVRTYWRVHLIRGLLHFLDLSEKGLGMTFYSDVMPDGLLIDGQPEPTEPEAPKWGLISGPQGSLLRFDEIEASFPLDTLQFFFYDDEMPLVEQCSGDGQSIGAAGWWIDQEIPNTDPRDGDHADLYSVVRTYFLAENRHPADIDYLVDYERFPLEITVETPATAVAETNELRLRVFPNPATDQVYVDIPEVEGSFEWLNAEGLLLTAGAIPAGRRIDLPQAAPGIYLLRLRTKNGTYTARIVKVRTD